MAHCSRPRSDSIRAVSGDDLALVAAGIEAGRTKQLPTPPDQIGTTVVVDPPPDYTPKFVAAETYKPMQKKARSEIRSDLLKMLQ